MISVALTACGLAAVNGAYAMCALRAAEHYGIPLSLWRGSGLYVLVAGTGIELAVVALQQSAVTTGMLTIAFGAAVVAAASDAACGYVFDAVTFPCLGGLAICALICRVFPSFALGALIAGGSLALLYALTRGKGLGLGDVKLACCIGGASGAAGAIETLGIAFVLGGSFAAYLLMSKRGLRGDEMRFAPYLAAGMAVAVLLGAFR